MEFFNIDILPCFLRIYVNEPQIPSPDEQLERLVLFLSFLCTVQHVHSLDSLFPIAFVLVGFLLWRFEFNSIVTINTPGVRLCWFDPRGVAVGTSWKTNLQMRRKQIRVRSPLIYYDGIYVFYWMIYFLKTEFSQIWRTNIIQCFKMLVLDQLGFIFIQLYFSDVALDVEIPKEESVLKTCVAHEIARFKSPLDVVTGNKCRFKLIWFEQAGVVQMTKRRTGLRLTNRTRTRRTWKSMPKMNSESLTKNMKDNNVIGTLLIVGGAENEAQVQILFWLLPNRVIMFRAARTFQL